MAVTRYSPATDAVGPLLEDFFRPLARMGTAPNLARWPAAEVIETEREILVELDVPGMAPGDIELVLENNTLTVSGERTPRWNNENRHSNRHLAERRYGRFSRSFLLPREVDQEAIQARFENGVLTVAVPKAEKARRRRIEIAGAEAAQQLETGTAGHQSSVVSRQSSED